MFRVSKTFLSISPSSIKNGINSAVAALIGSKRSWTESLKSIKLKSNGTIKTNLMALLFILPTCVVAQLLYTNLNIIDLFVLTIAILMLITII